MDIRTKTTRRNAICAGLTLLAAPAMLAPSAATAAVDTQWVSPEQTLLTEHGLLSRCLLIYEELTRRVRNVDDMPMDAFESTAQTVRDLIENVHERNEEALIFPAVSGSPLADLTAILVRQHRAGRAATDRILTIAAHFQYPNNQQKVVALAERYTVMMRAHTAREATVLFPAVSHIMHPEAASEAAQKMAADMPLFDKSLGTVAAIEKQLGIYDLAALTAVLPPD